MRTWRVFAESVTYMDSSNRGNFMLLSQICSYLSPICCTLHLPFRLAAPLHCSFDCSRLQYKKKESSLTMVQYRLWKDFGGISFCLKYVLKETTGTGLIFNYPSCLHVQVKQRIVRNGLSCTLHIKFHTIFPAPNIVHVYYASAYELSSIYP